MSKICVQFDKGFMVSKDLIDRLLKQKDFRADEVSLFFDLEFLENDISSDFCHLKEEMHEVHSLLRKSGIALNLLLDHVCWGGKNLMVLYQRRLERFLALISEENIHLVLTEPTLINFIASYYPEITFTIAASSSYGSFDFHLRSRHYEDYFNYKGSLKRIIIPSDLNRDFATLKAIRDACSCELSVRVNEGDIFCSPFRLSEETSLSHISPYKENDYYKMVEETFSTMRRECFLKDPWRAIASPWIRPEDVGYYEALGIDYFTIFVGRKSNISKLLKAYADRF